MSAVNSCQSTGSLSKASMSDRPRETSTRTRNTRNAFVQTDEMQTRSNSSSRQDCLPSVPEALTAQMSRLVSQLRMRQEENRVSERDFYIVPSCFHFKAASCIYKSSVYMMLISVILIRKMTSIQSWSSSVIASLT